MLVVSRQNRSFHDDSFQTFAKYVGPGDCLVLNNTKVFPARLLGRRNTHDGAKIEVFLTKALDGSEHVWQALLRPGKRVKTGDRLIFDGNCAASVREESEEGERIIEFSSSESIPDLLDRLGKVPLPPYIRREPAEADRERYQTVFAEMSGSVAAPTAGLHFTPQILDECRARGATIAYVTLHVGLGTFAPLRQKELSQVTLHRERFRISAAAHELMAKSRRLVCVGTTTVRTLESAALRGKSGATGATTDLFIAPGFAFRACGAMLTNFHLPESSLLILVSAFAGHELILDAYKHAVRERYRFFSYGDCMLIL